MLTQCWLYTRCYQRPIIVCIYRSTMNVVIWNGRSKLIPASYVRFDTFHCLCFIIAEWLSSNSKYLSVDRIKSMVKSSNAVAHPGVEFRGWAANCFPGKISPSRDFFLRRFWQHTFDFLEKPVVWTQGHSEPWTIESQKRLLTVFTKNSSQLIAKKRICCPLIIPGYAIGLCMWVTRLIF